MIHLQLEVYLFYVLALCIAVEADVVVPCVAVVVVLVVSDGDVLVADVDSVVTLVAAAGVYVALAHDLQLQA